MWDFGFSLIFLNINTNVYGHSKEGHRPITSSTALTVNMICVLLALLHLAESIEGLFSRAALSVLEEGQ